MNPTIYRIVNAINQKVYIGSTLTPVKRWNQHKNLLNSNKHPNSHLQASWNKYGPAAFEFEIMLTCPKDELIEREQWWVDYYKNHYGWDKMYNLAEDVVRFNNKPNSTSFKKGQTPWNKGKVGVYSEEVRTSMGRKGKVGPRLGQPVSEETRQKISDSKKGQRSWIGKTHSEESKMRMSIAKKGKPWSEARRAAQLKLGGC